MTALQMAREQCGNYLPTGKCLGVSLESGAIEPLSKCLVADKKRCPFFERYVLLLADSKAPRRKPYVQRGFVGARASYMRCHKLSETGGKPRHNAPVAALEGNGGANRAKADVRDAEGAEGSGK